MHLWPPLSVTFAFGNNYERLAGLVCATVETRTELGRSADSGRADGRIEWGRETSRHHGASRSRPRPVPLGPGPVGAPALRRSAAAVQRGLPGGREHPGLAGAHAG